MRSVDILGHSNALCLYENGRFTDRITGGGIRAATKINQ